MNKLAPLFLADWLQAVFIHFNVDADRLQKMIPFELDQFDGGGYISLVAFTQSRLRPARLGRLGGMLSLPLATHEFLNLRTYVRAGAERGIYFLAEWIPNPLAALIGPRMYGLPYRLGKLEYQHGVDGEIVRGVVSSGSDRFEYAGRSISGSACAARPVTLDDFLVERYIAFTHHSGKSRAFRIAHAPWPIISLQVEIFEASLIKSIVPWLDVSAPALAHYSPGVKDVSIGWPIRDAANQTGFSAIEPSSGSIPDPPRPSR